MHYCATSSTAAQSAECFLSSHRPAPLPCPAPPLPRHQQMSTSRARTRSRTSCSPTTAPCWWQTPAAASPRSECLLCWWRVGSASWRQRLGSVRAHARGMSLTHSFFMLCSLQVRRKGCQEPLPEELPLNDSLRGVGLRRWRPPAPRQPTPLEPLGTCKAPPTPCTQEQDSQYARASSQSRRERFRGGFDQGWAGQTVEGRVRRQ